MVDSRIRSCLGKCICAGIFLFVLGVAVGFTISEILHYRKAFEEDKIEEFVGQIVTSVTDDTELYKIYCRPDVSEELHNYRHFLTSLYRIHIFDETFGTYQCIVTFDNGAAFYADVIVYEDEMLLNQWLPDTWANFPVSEPNS